MSLKVGRNDPCPCGSGNKFKKCCISKQNNKPNGKPKFRFEPGSYGDIGSFTPSIACLKISKFNTSDYHFVLVNPNEIYEFEDEANKIAVQDLEGAFLQKEVHGTDSALALNLKGKGYVKVDDYKVISDNKNFKSSNYN